MTTQNEIHQSEIAASMKNKKIIFIVAAVVGLFAVFSICACLGIIGLVASKKDDNNRQSQQPDQYQQLNDNYEKAAQCLNGCNQQDVNALMQCIDYCTEMYPIPTLIPALDQQNPSSQDAVSCARYQRNYDSCMEMYNIMKDGPDKSSVYQSCLGLKDGIDRYCP